jgi:DNA-binding GntR family transcriptional regulator
MTSAERVTLRLAVEIVTGSLPPGMRLDETAQSKRLGVSRTPLREALSYLSALGLADNRPNHGVHVVEDAGPQLLAGAIRDLVSVRVRAILPGLDPSRRDRFAEAIRDGGDWLGSFHRETGNSITGRISQALWRILLATGGDRRIERETAGIRHRLARAVADADADAAIGAMHDYVDLWLALAADAAQDG